MASSHFGQGGLRSKLYIAYLLSVRAVLAAAAAVAPALLLAKQERRGCRIWESDQ